MYKIVNGKKRIFYLDFIRALAIILVILAHVTRAFFQNANPGGFNIHFVAPFIDFVNNTTISNIIDKPYKIGEIFTNIL